jgi:RHS repeat-associated protein
LTSITNGTSKISYLYDANGNINSISYGGLVIQYLYDELGQVIRENNQRENITVIYDYDFGGNILSKKTYGYTTGSVDGLTPTDTDTYEYENTNWIDQLTSFNGLTMTYDEIGNIKTYNGNTFNWDKGRQLSSITSAGPTISYTYNDSGIRTSKTVGSTTTSYHLNGDKVTYEKTGNVYSYYTYDSNGQLISINYNGNEYTYIRNGQNDIIGLVDSAGTIVVNYTYSTYGEIVSTTGSLASTLGIANPYRYRGYRFDMETGYYYLQSRYYDPQIGRFINADSASDNNSVFIGQNLYAYCANNPIIYSDANGESVVLAVIISAVVLGGIAGWWAKTNKDENISKNWGWYALGGAVIGGAVAYGIGAIVIPYIQYKIMMSTAISMFGMTPTSGGFLVELLKTTFETTKTVVSERTLYWIIKLCDYFKVDISATMTDLTVGHGAWPLPHMHVGRRRIHIALTEKAAEIIMEILGLK